MGPCHDVAYLSALQALAESTRMDVNNGMYIVVSGSSQRNGAQNHRWKRLEIEQTGPCSRRQPPSLPDSFCTFSSAWI